jgi:hypothetical protein
MLLILALVSNCSAMYIPPFSVKPKTTLGDKITASAHPATLKD